MTMASSWGYDVIMIDDNPDDIALLANALQTQPTGWAINWRVHDYPSLVTAEKTLKSNSADMVMLDLNLLETAGIETVRLAVDMTKMPIVITTGHLTPEVVRAAVEYGLCHCLDKSHAITTPAYLHFVLLDCIERYRVVQQTDRLQRTLTGEYIALIASCSRCHRWRSEGENQWLKPEDYMERYADVSFSHGMCPDCLKLVKKQIITGEE